MSSKNNNRVMLLEIFDKLHNDDVLYKNKIKKYQEKYEKKLKEENTFKPKIYNNSFTRKYSKDKTSFIQRQKSFLEKKEKNSEKIKKLMEDNFTKIYSFSPVVNTTKKENFGMNIRRPNKLSEYYTNYSNKRTQSTKCISPFLRLYEDSKTRNKRKKQREKDHDNRIIDMANNSSRKDNIVDYEKINELYMYKKKKDIIRKTRKKVEDEEGSTFKPSIYVNECSKYITNGFYERNERFLKDKQNFIEHSIKEQNKLLIHKDNFSNEKKKEIVENIVKKLAIAKK